MVSGLLNSFYIQFEIYFSMISLTLNPLLRGVWIQPLMGISHYYIDIYSDFLFIYQE